MTIQQAAQQALDVQYACNMSGITRSLAEIISTVLWPIAIAKQLGTSWVNSHPIVTMFLLKMSELNGCGSTLDKTYEPAESECIRLAGTSEVGA